MLSKHGLALAGLAALASTLSFTSAQSQYGDQYWHERYHGESTNPRRQRACRKARVPSCKHDPYIDLATCIFSQVS